MKDTNTVSICKLCNCPCTHFARSHSIPWGFMKKSPYANDMSLSAKGEYPRFLPQWLYDEHMVCDKCEHDMLYGSIGDEYRDDHQRLHGLGASFEHELINRYRHGHVKKRTNRGENDIIQYGIAGE